MTSIEIFTEKGKQLAELSTRLSGLGQVDEGDDWLIVKSDSGHAWLSEDPYAMTELKDPSAVEILERIVARYPEPSVFQLASNYPALVFQIIRLLPGVEEMLFLNDAGRLYQFQELVDEASCGEGWYLGSNN